MTTREMFQMHLDDNHLPGYLLGMIEERIYAVLYLDEVFIVGDPLDGFYGICEDFPTLRDYVAYHGIGKDISIEDFIEFAPEVYDKARLTNKVRLAYAEVA